MLQARYYSPKIRRDLVSKLYWKAQAKNIRLCNPIAIDRIQNFPNQGSTTPKTADFAKELT